MEDSLYEVASMRHFAGLALHDDRIVDESTILQFRHLLARHHLRQGLFEAVERHLREQGYHLSKGTRVDATLIEASGSTRNQARERDREMRSTRKEVVVGELAELRYYFGMKVSIGADVHSGAAHEVAVTAAHEADINQLPNLLRADDEAVFGDACLSAQAACLASGQAGRCVSVAPVVDGLLTGEVRLKGAKGLRKQQKTRCSVLTRD